MSQVDQVWRARSPSSIEFRHLRCFLAAAEHGSFRKAGVALRVRESAISRRIRDLEGQLGAILFHRHHAGVRLTEVGHAFLRDAEGVFDRLEDGCSAARAAASGRRGLLRVAATEEVVGERLADILAAHRARCPDVQMGLVEMIATEQARAIRDGDIDLGLRLEGDDLGSVASEALWSKRCVAALPAAHPLAGCPTLGCADLHCEGVVAGHAERGPHCSRHVVDALRHAHTEIRPVAEVEHMRTMLMLVQSGLGIAVLPAPFAGSGSSGIVFRDVTGIVGPLTVQAVWPAGDPSGLVGQFPRTVRAVVADDAVDLNAPLRLRSSDAT